MSSFEIDNPFNNPISFEAMKLAFLAFEEACSKDEAPDDIEEILEENIFFSESRPLLEVAAIRLMGLIELLSNPIYKNYIHKITDKNGVEGFEVDDAIIYACAKSGLDDEMSFIDSDILEKAKDYSRNPLLR